MYAFKGINKTNKLKLYFILYFIFFNVEYKIVFN